MSRNGWRCAILVLATALLVPACGRKPDDPVPPPAPPGETEPNNLPGAANYLGPEGGTYSVTGRIDPMGDVDYFSVDVLVGSILTLDLTNLPADYGLDLNDDLGVLVASSNNPSTTSEQIVHVASTAGRYTILVYGVGGAFDAGQSYLLTVNVTLPGALEPRFGTGGIITINPDPGPNDAFNSGAIDLANGFMYLVGGVGDGTGTNFMWRIEKRLLSDGSLVAGFGVGGTGVETSDPNPATSVLEEATAIAIDVANNRMYVVGTEVSGGGDTNWRFEKRLLTTGALDSTFGVGGAWGSAASFGEDRPNALAIDGTWMYIAGFDEQMGAGNRQWRIEKRSLATGLEDGSFGTAGVILSSPAGDEGGPQAMAIDVPGGRMYVVGTSITALTDQQWQVEKRMLSDGAGDPGFGTNGVLPADPSPGNDELRSIALDTAGGFMILVGDDSSNGGFDRRWRIEKRQLSDGAPVPGFGTGGVVLVDPGTGFDFGIGAFLDGSSLYVSGVAHLNPPFPGQDFQIVIEKRDAVTGLPVALWGTAGRVTENPTPLADGLGVLGADGTYIYLAGLENADVLNGVQDQGWRIEKRTK